ncbi:GNAT family N-acetyltransferase [Streptacidiphilus sp. N1-12]|uniref:GNAT family N-acetyltransferase n=2 Tax=Streptacidiphilus alkalitolerans TaxID=3342712 RepID=A0ABV6W7Y3_9ACTN
MLNHHWPLFGLHVRTPRLELRLPDAEELAELGDLAARGVHDPARMPFNHPWTDLPPAERARSVLQYFWLSLGRWTAEDWSLLLGVFRDGTIVGLQEVCAKDFATLREVRTGSWLGLEHHGQGIGTEMRAAVLHLAFAGLGAEQARSGAFSDNPASLAVSRGLGYRPDGIHRLVVRGAPVTEHRLRLTRDQWETGPQHAEVTIDGLAPCLPLLGASA